MANKHASVLSEELYNKVLAFALQRSRVPESDRLKILLSFKAGLRACEIARIRVDHMTDANGRPAREVTVFSSVSKGGRMRVVPMHKDIRDALEAFMRRYPTAKYVAISSRRRKRGRPTAMTANAIAQWFFHLFKDMGLKGASSHSGRRTFATNATRKLGSFGMTIVDVQKLLGHARLDTTQAYVEPSDNTIALVNAI